MVADDLVLRKRQVHLLCKEAMWAGGMHWRHQNAGPARLRAQAQLRVSNLCRGAGLKKSLQRSATACTNLAHLVRQAMVPL